MKPDYISPSFQHLNDRQLCWRHYISDIDQNHWEEYPEELKRMIYNLASNMMHYDVERMDKGSLGN